MKILYAILFLAVVGCADMDYLQRKEVLLTLKEIKTQSRFTGPVRFLRWESNDGKIVIVSEEEIYGSCKIGDRRYAFVK